MTLLLKVQNINIEFDVFLLNSHYTNWEFLNLALKGK
jgi:hypothetical protein